MKDVFATTSNDALADPGDLSLRIRKALRHAFLSTCGTFSNPHSGTYLRCIYSHYVFDNELGNFRAIIESIKNFGTFVDSETAISILHGEQPLDGRYFHLSFDDGFKNIVTNAVPILRSLKVPALYFVPTAFIGCTWEESRRFSMSSPFHKAPIETANWNDLRNLDPSLIEIGSHSRNHQRLSQIIEPQALKDEILSSKLEIENRLQRECKYFSWPYGTASDISESAIAIVKEVGYKACFSAIRGKISPRITDRFYIPRHHFEAFWPKTHVRYFLSGNGEIRL